jgi:GR25 family glycosyltransferase involved in LPS biosynthesis
MNLVYQLFHIDGVNPERDAAALKIRTSLELPRLNSYTLSTPPEDMLFLRDFKKGEMGLWGSTYTALQKFLESDYYALLILEDDVELDAEFVQKAQSYIERLPSDWDFFYQYIHWWQVDNRYDLQYEYGDDLLCKAYQVWGNGCFWVSRKGAEKVLYEVAKEGINEPTDWFILKRGLEGLYNNYTVKPGVEQYCHLLNFATTIQDDN